jgi:hypothetical protein
VSSRHKHQRGAAASLLTLIPEPSPGSPIGQNGHPAGL